MRKVKKREREDEERDREWKERVKKKEKMRKVKKRENVKRVRKEEDEDKKKMRKNKIKKRWIRGEGVVYASKRGRVLEICGERKEDKRISYLYIYFVFLLF